MTYAEKLKDPRWQKKRLEILSRDEFTCTLCGDKETELHIHHKKYTRGNDPWDYPDENFKTLCKHCHFSVEHLIGLGYEFTGGMGKYTITKDYFLFIGFVIWEGDLTVSFTYVQNGFVVAENTFANEFFEQILSKFKRTELSYAKPNAATLG